MHRPAVFRSALPLAALLLVFLPACHSGQIRLVNSYRARLDPILGTGTRDDVAREFGIPTATHTIARSEVWEYRKSRGVETNANVWGSKFSTASAESHEVFEKLTVFFDAVGVLQSWTLETQDGVLTHEDSRGRPSPNAATPEGH